MLTPQQAASRAQVSRGTIMNAIKDGHLFARRDNRNRWQIEPADLLKWLSD
ncbi:helix-turn-helix domain-containing protein, partial [Paracoccus salipaludis]